MIRFQKVERDTDAAAILRQPATVDELKQAVAEAPNLVMLEAHVNLRTGLPFTGKLTDAPIGLYTTTCLDGTDATVTCFDNLFSVR